MFSMKPMYVRGVYNASSIPLPQDSWHNPQDQGYAPRRVPDKGHSGRSVLPLPVCEYNTEGGIMSCQDCDNDKESERCKKHNDKTKPCVFFCYPIMHYVNKRNEMIK